MYQDGPNITQFTLQTCLNLCELAWLSYSFGPLMGNFGNKFSFEKERPKLLDAHKGPRFKALYSKGQLVDTREPVGLYKANGKQSSFLKIPRWVQGEGDFEILNMSRDLIDDGWKMF